MEKESSNLSLPIISLILFEFCITGASFGQEDIRSDSTLQDTTIQVPESLEEPRCMLTPHRGLRYEIE